MEEQKGLEYPGEVQGVEWVIKEKSPQKQLVCT